MTEISQKVLNEYQVRKSKKQKTAFIDFVKEFAAEKGYNCNIEKFLGCRNIVIGDVDNAKVVYTAHYDTCARLPFPNFITPKSFGIYLLYQLAIILPLIIIAGVGAFCIGALTALVGTLLELDGHTIGVIARVIYYILFLGGFAFLFFGPIANKNTANDNTSGVTTLLNIINDVPEFEKEKVAFVFFDLEEVGTVGSFCFSVKHSKAMKKKLLVNFDCVSDGEYMIFALKKKAREYKEIFDNAFPSTEFVNSEVLTKGVFYPSDQANFNMGVGVASLKKSKKFSLLYMDRIHTKKDTVYRGENISFLTDGAIKLVELI